MKKSLLILLFFALYCCSFKKEANADDIVTINISGPVNNTYWSGLKYELVRVEYKSSAFINSKEIGRETIKCRETNASGFATF